MNCPELMTAREVANLLGVSESNVRGRSGGLRLYDSARHIGGFPAPTRDERIGRVFWNRDELRDFCRRFREAFPTKSLFSPARLAGMTDEEREYWFTPSPREDDK